MKIRFCLFFAVSFFLCGCMKNIDIAGERKEVEYVICKESNLPGQLKILLEEKKKKAGTFTYRNSMYMYLVVCYGKKPYSGFSVKVEDCYATKDTLFLRTQLMGPAAQEPVAKTQTFPYIVLRCRQMDVFCIIDA